MTTIDRVRVELVEAMPDVLESGVFYISQRHRLALHACCCGCGEEVSTPLGPTEYSISVQNGRASVLPSIGNHDFPCKSHYLIENGEVVWAGIMSRRDIAGGRRRDRILKRGRQSIPARLVAWARKVHAISLDKISTMRRNQR